ncbi:MAG: dUTP diphosphatase [Alphaproteobacteria bacterium]
MSTITVQIEQLPHGAGLDLPAYASNGASGMDLRAAVTEPVTLNAGGRIAVPTGVRIALPQGTEAQIRPRSGLALEHGVTVMNAPGTIDADYRGEVMVLLVNLSRDKYVITRGLRIAQMVVAPVAQAAFDKVNRLPGTLRGEGGFGSTGS